MVKKNLNVILGCTLIGIFLGILIFKYLDFLKYLCMTIGLNNGLLALSLFLGPWLSALYIHKYEDTGRQEDKQEEIFRILMATKGSVSFQPEQQIEALNTVPIVFYGQQDIKNAWTSYQTYICMPGLKLDDVGEGKRKDLYGQLLKEISIFLHYEFEDIVFTQSYVPGAVLNKVHQVTLVNLPQQITNAIGKAILAESEKENKK